MHLKRLEALGFKSFADKISLDFTSGVTCIVGPNGCGKSNVCDSIKWVLGEQNARNIRSGGQGKTMQEVIFKGTDTRSRMNYCEVSLSFDNTDRFYRVEAEELTITRKLFRTGESEYYINKQKARLKDIIDLFRDTGIGKDGYSVVGQGQIDAILSAKPEDRRQIFEEAAGISKYKADRKEAMGHLDKAIQNLRSLDEQLKVLENIITPLRKEAETAIKAKVLSARIKVLDINHFLYVADHSEEQRVRIREKLAKENAEFAIVTEKKAKADAIYDQAEAELIGIDEKYRVLNERRVQLSVEEANRRKDDEHLGARLAQTSKDIERYTQDIDEKTKQVGVQELSVVEYSRQIEEKNAEYLQAKSDEQAAIDTYTKLNEEATTKQTEITLTTQVMLNAADKSGIINADIAMLTAQKKALEDNIERRNGEIGEHRDEMKKADKSIATMEDGIAQKNTELGRNREEQKALIDKINQVAAELQDMQDRFQEKLGTMSALNGKKNLLESTRSTYGSYDKAVKHLMTHTSPSVKSRICGVIGDLLKVSSPKFATAIDIALGGNVNNIVVENPQDADYLIKVIKDAGVGRATFYPISNMHPRPLEPLWDSALNEDGVYGLAADLVRFDSKYADVVETLLGRVLIVEDNETASRISEKYRFAFRMVTLAGDNHSTSGSISGGSKGMGESRILSLENEITEINKRITALQKEYQLLKGEIESTTARKKEMETAASVIGNVIVRLKEEISSLDQQKVFMSQTRSKHEFEIDRLRSENNSDMQKVAEKTAQIAVQSKETSDQSATRSDSSDAMTILRDQLSDIKRKLNDADIRRTELLSKTKGLERDIGELQSALSVSQKTIERLRKEISETKALLDTGTAEKDNLLLEIQRITAQSCDSEELKKVSEELGELDVKKSRLNEQMKNARNDSSALAERLSEISGQKAKWEANLENVDTEIATLTESIREDYQLEYVTALPYRDETYNETTGTAENKTLKKQLRDLGPINENAENSLALHEGSYNETKRHYDDVIAAKATLETSIQNFTEQMETQFAQSFEKIKANFAEVFTMLFDGGRGKLELDRKPGESVLDAGILIEAEPPGKKLANINLLSGGERALTAIAIIFAIIKLSPMPFCVLDEVDAPLDDANARIYARFLQKFSKRTQFIIISHRKPTMELANELYGITMQEQGVSKHLSVKLSEALALANKGDSQ